MNFTSFLLHLMKVNGRIYCALNIWSYQMWMAIIQKTATLHIFLSVFMHRIYRLKSRLVRNKISFSHANQTLEMCIAHTHTYKQTHWLSAREHWHFLLISLTFISSLFVFSLDFIDTPINKCSSSNCEKKTNPKSNCSRYNTNVKINMKKTCHKLNTQQTIENSCETINEIFGKFFFSFLWFFYITPANDLTASKKNGQRLATTAQTTKTKHFLHIGICLPILVVP